MQKRITVFIAVLFVTSTMGACVKQSTYQKRDAEAVALTQTVEELTSRINLLTREREELLGKLKSTSDEAGRKIAVLEEENLKLKADIAELREKKEQVEAERNTLDQENLKLKADIAELREKKEQVEAERNTLDQENLKLKADIAELREKKEQVEAESNTYKELTREMKSELAKGEMTIKELKGKLTLDVVDRILFASGEAKVKEEGLEVLRRVSEILKNVKDRDIRIEGHTDNVRIKGMLARIYPTNWELSAARAINVVRLLQEQGLEPSLLSGAAFGEYRPLGDNETEEGRARNRRIAIVLVPKD
jgi:chemotaxis protein MotB